jgi:hypothetical protein
MTGIPMPAISPVTVGTVGIPVTTHTVAGIPVTGSFDVAGSAYARKSIALLQIDSSIRARDPEERRPVLNSR